MNIRESTIRELSLKFLVTFNFHKSNQINYDWEDIIEFQLGGIPYFMSILEFGVKYGFYDKDFLETERY